MTRIRVLISNLRFNLGYKIGGFRHASLDSECGCSCPEPQKP